MKKFSDSEFRELIKNEDIIFSLNDPQFKKFLKIVGTDSKKGGQLVDSATGLPEHFITQENAEYRKVSGVMAGSKIFLRKNIADLSKHMVDKGK